MRMRKGAALFLAVVLLLPGVIRAEMQISQQDFDALYGPYCRLEGDAVILNEGITALGWYQGEMVWDDEEQDWVQISNPEDEALFTEDWRGFTGEDFTFRRVQWPASIRYLGEGSFHLLSFDEFILPSAIEKVFSDAFVYCNFSVFRIEAEVPWQQIWDGLYDCHVYAWNAPADHPLYRAVDGVLFTRDGKTLLSYPNARTDAHYDVPKGVERIASWAFDNPYLQTVSLPIGLKAVESRAFSGCTRLHAIALPLTVTEMGENVFVDCVSLDLVSLPEKITARKDEGEYYKNDGLFHGDNGGTEQTGDKKRRLYFEWDYYDDVYAPARLANGGENVKVYADWQGDQTVTTLPGGAVVFAQSAREGRCLVDQIVEEGREEIGWVDMEQLQMICNETLFSYAAGRPPLEMVGEGAASRPLVECPWYLELFGPLAQFDLYGIYAEDEKDLNVSVGGVCLLWQADMYRRADGPEGEYGYVYGDDPYALLSLLQAPGGEEGEWVYPGTQVRVMEKKDGWARVATGFSEGWIRESQVRIVPRITEDIR